MSNRFLIVSFYSFILVLLCRHGHAQNTEVVPLFEKQVFYLNGGNRALLGGDSRIYLEVDLPENTIDWYYAFSTAASESETDNMAIGLAAQLTKFADPTGLAASATTALLSPAGSGTCNVYVTDKENADVFEAKSDKYGVPFNYYIAKSRENFRNGIVEIDEVVSGKVYLCFKNPSDFTGVAVTLDVVAVVKKKSDETKRAEMLGTMGWQAYERGDVDRCLELSQQAIEMDNSLSWVHFNIGLVYLLKQQQNEALDAYLTALSVIKQLPHARQFIAAAVEDIQNANLLESNHAVEIIELLSHEFDLHE